MGTKWLIVGFGAIGQAVAQRSRAFGASIVGIRRDQSQHPLADTIATLEHSTALVTEADVIVLSLPLNAATHKIVDSAFFEATQPGAILVNVGRGGGRSMKVHYSQLWIQDSWRMLCLTCSTRSSLSADSRFWTHPRVDGHRSYFRNYRRSSPT